MNRLKINKMKNNRVCIYKLKEIIMKNNRTRIDKLGESSMNIDRLKQNIIKKNLIWNGNILIESINWKKKITFYTK